MKPNNLILLALCLLLITVACTEAAITATAPAASINPTWTPPPPMTVTVPPDPVVTVVDDVVSIAVPFGFEESCVDPYEIYFDDDGQWRSGSFLPYQGDYILDDEYIVLEWQDEGCDVVGDCEPFYDRTIDLEKFTYHFLGRQDTPDGSDTAFAYESLPLSDQIRVEVNYYIDDECRRLAHYETELSR